ncbi:hypothetical protein L249_5452 [Ophiocordyceps polyrhachis-furcata BCC 54312]|uniref:Myb-like domain-containing protein n=1 Tax=Ophiocordyceps polyrhachis-furcata BCC 54312 TaxID=1330021 RepID=A0A367LGZ4_9HYPO|nr:hypothetical protein L249_5452 [Ophiocordyceps polyrhachis-furcata BCC 54312]
MASYSKHDSSCDDGDFHGDSVEGVRSSLADASLNEGPATLVNTDHASAAKARTVADNDSVVSNSQGLTETQGPSIKEPEGAFPEDAKCLDDVKGPTEDADNGLTNGASSPGMVTDGQKPANGKLGYKKVTEATDDVASSIISGSEMYSDDEFEHSDENDDAYTEPSTLGADSTYGACDGEELKKTHDLSERSSMARTCGWSVSDDDLLRGLKRSSKLSWAEIGQALGKTRQEARNRWRKLQWRLMGKTRKAKKNEAAEEASKTGLEESFLPDGEGGDEDEAEELNANYGWPPKDHANHGADEFDGPSDRDVLASEKDGFKKAKWLECQANFMNAAGELVPLYVIRENWLRTERDKELQQQVVDDEQDETRHSGQDENAEATGSRQGGLNEAHV